MRGFKSADSYYKFSRDVCRSNRYFRGSETDEFFAILLQQAQLRRNLIPKGTIFYRAQLGHGLEPITIRKSTVAMFHALSLRIE